MAPPRALKRYDAAGPPDPDEFLSESSKELELLRQRLEAGHLQPDPPTEPQNRFRPWPVKAETGERADAAPARAQPRPFTTTAIGAGVVAILALAAVSLWPVTFGNRAAPVVISTSTVTLTSNPDGAEVLIDGQPAGKTPLSLSLAVGAHTAELRSGASSRRTPLTVEAGKIVSQHVEFGGAPATGGLDISSEPAGAQVSVDGTLRGVTPLRIPDIAPGRHRVTVSSGRTAVERTVDVNAGSTATIVVSVPRAVSPGWVSVDAPVDLAVYEAGRHLGSGRTLRISLAPGSHTLELVNQAIGFRTESIVNVPSGGSVTVPVAMGTGTLSINAVPWAEVFVDGRPAGQTPLGNLSVSLGPHEIVWRHPEYGERRQTVLVTATEPVRLGIDWTR